MKLLSCNAYTLKLLAVIAMIMNHVAIAFHAFLPLPAMLVLYAVGGLTYTIMGYFVVEGYRHTSNLRKYISRLLVFGLIAQAFHPMVLGVTQLMPGIFLNIMFTISLSLIVLLMYDKIKIRILFWLLFIVSCIVAMFMDLYFIAVLMTLLYYAIKKEGLRRTLPGIIAGIIWLLFGLLNLFSIVSLQNMPGGEQQAQYILENMGMTMDFIFATPTFAMGCFLGAIMIKNYNGDRGKPAKWLFYIAYPLHLAVLAGIAVAMGIIEFNLFGL